LYYFIIQYKCRDIATIQSHSVFILLKTYIYFSFKNQLLSTHPDLFISFGFIYGAIFEMKQVFYKKVS